MSLAHFKEDIGYTFATDVGQDLGLIFLFTDVIFNFIAVGPKEFLMSAKFLVDCAFIITFIVIVSIEPNGFFRSTLQIAVTVRWIEPLSELSRIYRASALFVLLKVVKMSLVHLQNMWVTLLSS